LIRRALAIVAIVSVSLSAQGGGTRRATDIAALQSFPGFYHGRPILIVGTVGVEKDQLRVSDDSGSIHLIVTGNAPDGLDEVRGEYWDIGRMKPDDLKLKNYDLKTVFHVDPEAPWPRPGEVTAIIASAVTPASIPQTASIRSIVLTPSRYLDQRVTITGQFSGRNLMGDLPEAPAKSRYDFAMRTTDAAIWIINMRPKLRDSSNKEIELGLDARIDTGRWLEVSGKVQQARGLLWIDAEAGSLKFGKAPTESVVTEEPVRVAMGPPPEVVFSAPTEDETDVATTATVRIQLSRDLNASTLRNHIQVGYVEAQGRERGEPDTPKIDFTYQYNASNRVIELRFKNPFERFRTVKVTFLDGVLGTDEQPLRPWTLTFMTGGA
jgi:hypothetical protein